MFTFDEIVKRNNIQKKTWPFGTVIQSLLGHKSLLLADTQWDAAGENSGSLVPDTCVWNPAATGIEAVNQLSLSSMCFPTFSLSLSSPLLAFQISIKRKSFKALHQGHYENPEQQVSHVLLPVQLLRISLLEIDPKKKYSKPYTLDYVQIH